MPLLFYATNYNSDRARAEIQKLLLTIGARRVSYEFSGSEKAPRVAAISFTLATVHGEMEYMLPARVEKVRAVLAKQGVLRGAGRRTILQFRPNTPSPSPGARSSNGSRCRLH